MAGILGHRRRQGIQTIEAPLGTNPPDERDADRPIVQIARTVEQMRLDREAPVADRRPGSDARHGRMLHAVDDRHGRIDAVGRQEFVRRLEVRRRHAQRPAATVAPDDRPLESCT